MRGSAATGVCDCGGRELILDVARDRRLFLLEASIVALIVLEIALSFVRPH